jgi:YidC/Oxa1 family membrane protein insertase
MNKRFFVALLLTGVVVLLTPLLFKSTRRPSQPVGTDSTATRAAERDTQTAAPQPRSQPAAPPAAAVTRTAEMPAAAETTVVATPKARLRLSNLGGALIGAELSDYQTLGAVRAPVELARVGESLLRFRIVAGGDTLALDRFPFHAEAQSDPTQVLFRGTVHDVPVAIHWSFAPDTYRVTINRIEQPVGYAARVEVRAVGLAAGAYLLVDLPPGFRSSEVDSTTDYTHLAYAFKRASGGADLVRFGKLNPGDRAIKPGPISWAVGKSKYFLVGVLAPSAAEQFTELQVTGAVRTGRLATTGQATVVVPLHDGAASLETYVGPQDWRRLIAMGREFETANPYGGWMQGLIQPFATIVMRLLLSMKDFFKLNYGVTLIIFGVAIRLVLWPLNQMAMRSSLRMQRVQPELAAAQKKYASNPEKQRDEIMRIYREHGMSPFSALSGCLPMLIPMPVLFALFFVFQNTIEFRGVSFWWMADISQYDPLYILPVAMALSMFMLSWLGVRNAPPNPQAKMMMYFLPLMMGFFLFKFAAGLNLYYAAQNLAAIPQQWLIANERAKITPRTG